MLVKLSLVNKVMCRTLFILFLSMSTLMTSLVLAESNTHHHFDAVIFDCDGVLVDTENLKFLSWKESLKQYGVHFTLDEYIPLVGYSSRHILESILSKKKIDLPMAEILDKKTKYYKTLKAQNSYPIQSAVDFVKKLSLQKNKLKIKLALASSAPKEEIMRNLEAIGLEKVFDAIISGEDDLKDIYDKDGTNKPKPYIYQRLAMWLKVKPENCVVFEDTSAGVTAAATAGMYVFAVPNELTLHQDFSKATRILKSLTELDINFVNGE